MLNILKTKCWIYNGLLMMHMFSCIIHYHLKFIFRVLGTSGQPVTNIMRYSELDDAVDILDKCITWGHIAPTAPDSLGIYYLFTTYKHQQKRSSLS